MRDVEPECRQPLQSTVRSLRILLSEAQAIRIVLILATFCINFWRDSNRTGKTK